MGVKFSRQVKVALKISQCYNCLTVGAWPSQVGHLHGVQGVASSNLAAPTSNASCQKDHLIMVVFRFISVMVFKKFQTGGEAVMTTAKPAYQEQLEAYCVKQGIKWLATYNADIVRRNYPGADLFLLVEFEEGRRVGREFFKIERELTDIIGGAFGDLKALPELADYYRDEILAAATVRFASETATHLPRMLAAARNSWAAISAAEKQAVKDKVRDMPSEELAEFCHSNGIKWLAACDADRGSDNFFNANLVLVAEFEKGYPKHWGSFNTERKLAALYDVAKVDLLSLSALRDRKDEILAVAQVQFAS